jgi:membrane protease YdiL (CAAX protease family)
MTGRLAETGSGASRSGGVSPVGPPRRHLNLFWRIALFWVAFNVADISPVLPTIGLVTLLRLPEDAVRYIGPVLVAPCVLVLVCCFWRFVDGRAWPTRSDLGMSLSARAPLHLLLGLVISGLVVAAASVLAVMTRTASITLLHWDVGLVSYLVTNLVFTALLLQGFPEEIAFRGYVLVNLARSLPLWLALSVTALLFASVHVLSDPPHVVQALALGLLLTASRIASGSLWLPIGIHAGFDFFEGSGKLPVQPVAADLLGWGLVPWMVLCLAVATALVLAARQWRRPLDWRGRSGPP